MIISNFTLNTILTKLSVKLQFLIIVILFVFISLNCSENKKASHKINITKTNTVFEDPPKWAKEVIWYQIFVERFRNGDSTNDPTPADIEGAYPGYVPKSWHITPWTHDWYKADSYFEELEDKNDFFGNKISSFSQKAQLRRYGGDLQGVLDKINYLDSLGITAIYFNPLNDAPSLHKYDARHWRHIDRNFGPDPKKDLETISLEIPDDPSTWKFTEADILFIRVIDEFHKRGIKVILDYSWNHTGHTFWAWKDLVKNQKESNYADWYWINKFDDPNTLPNEFDYRGWSWVIDLPEIKETKKYDHSKPVQPFEGTIYDESAKQHIFNVSQRWLDPNGDGNPSDGVDGFRLDVAAEMPLGFWREYRKVVKDINPDAYLLGEIWWEEWPDKLLDPKPFLEGDIFDGVMNYRWYRVARHFFNASPDEMTVSEFVNSLQSLLSNLRNENNYAMMNMTASHDVPRVATSLFNKNKYKVKTSPFATGNYKIHKPDTETYNTLKLLLAHQFTYIGAPQIWAGDEMGMWGADEPSTRKPLIWSDYDFDAETIHPLGKNRPKDEVNFNSDLFKYYQSLITIRKSNPVLIDGDIDFILSNDQDKILAYSRFSKNDEVIAVFNTGDKKQTIQLQLKTSRNYKDLLSDDVIYQSDDSSLKITMPRRSTAILVSLDK